MERKKFYVLDEDYKLVHSFKSTDKDVKNVKSTTYNGYNIKRMFNLFIFVSCIFLFMLISSLNSNINYKNEQIKALQADVDKYYEEYMIAELHALIGKFSITPTTPIDEDTLYNFIKDCGIWYPDIVFAQCKIESGCGESELYKKGNNLIGMRQPKSRETTAITPCISPNGYAYYKNWQSCILDRMLWDISIFKKKPSKEEYLSTISRIYAEDTGYVSKIRSLIRK